MAFWGGKCRGIVMSAAYPNAGKGSPREACHHPIASLLARTLIFCAILAIGFGAPGMRCFTPAGGDASLWNCSCIWIARANADDKDAEKEAKEREKERAKEEKEREKEQAKQDREQQREQEKTGLEREFKQSEKELEKSGAGEKEKKEPKDRVQRDKKARESRFRGSQERPPATLLEFFKRTFKPRAKKTRDDDEDNENESRRRVKKPRDDEEKPKRRAKKPRDDAEKPKRRAKKPGDDEEKPKRSAKKRNRTKKRSRRVVDLIKPVNSSFRSKEVLAVNPDAGEQRAAEKLGFRVISSTDISGVRGRVVRFATPTGLDARKARQLLRRTIPNGSFELNKKYRLYRTAKEPPRQAKRGVATHNSNRAGRKARSAEYACEADHCFSHSVLRWKPELAACSGGVRIGIIDTNVDLTHRTFQGQRIRVGNFISSEQQSSSDNHGTAVASILAGSHDSGTPGLVPAADFFAANAFYKDENGQPATDTLTLLKALDWLDAWDVQLVNMSFVGPKDRLMRDAFQRMTRKHAIFVAATGNEGPAAPPRYPAAYPEVIAVTAVNRKLRNYRRANRGHFVDVAAPGVKIWTALRDNREGYQSGTSFATPHVTALLATIYKSHANERTLDQLMNYLPVQDLGAQGRDPIYGRGLVMAPPDCRGSKGHPATIAQAATGVPGKDASEPVALSSAELSWEPDLLRDRAAPRSPLSLNRK